MSKPEDISQEAWDAAIAVFGPPNVAVDVEDIARAILAAKAEEREACARVAEFAETVVPDEWLNVAAVRKRHAYNIAAAIRKRGEA